jgi:predicted RND superfamily exporter protein
LPGLLGILLAVIGYANKITWVTVIGLVLAAPIIWSYAVVLIVLPPLAVATALRRRLRK